MPILRLPAEAVLLTGQHLAAALAVCRLEVERRGKQVPRVLEELVAELAAGCPQRDRQKAATAQHEAMTTAAAAAFLGVSPRTVRRRAPGLGGRKISGRVFVDGDAVREHHEGTERK